MRRIRAVVAVTCVAATLGMVADAATAAVPSQSITVQPNKLSSLYTWGSCHYRVQAGNFGSTSYLQLHRRSVSECPNSGLFVGGGLDQGSWVSADAWLYWCRGTSCSFTSAIADSAHRVVQATGPTPSIAASGFGRVCGLGGFGSVCRDFDVTIR